MRIEYLSLAILSSAFYGSQFVPQKYCQKFSHELYNISMNFGIIFISSIFFILFLKIGFGLDGYLDIISGLIGIASGVVWVIGNRFLLVSVENSGMGRSFTIINMVSVVTYLGGVIFLGELSSLSQREVAISGLGVLLVTFGSMLVTFTSTKDETGSKVKYGMIFAFLSSFFFGASNLLIVVAMNILHLPFTYTFFFVGLGAFLGMVLTTFLKFENIKNWKRVPKEWHAFAFSSGILWGLGDVFGVLSIKNVGGSIGVPILQGGMTLISAAWGLGVFREFKSGDKDEFKGMIWKFLVGIIITLSGVWALAQI